MRTVRIQRKRKSNLTMAVNWMNFIFLGLKWALQPYIDQEKAIVANAKLAKIRKDTELAEIRKQVQMNEVVIRDLKIERDKLQLELLEHKARMLGLRSGGDDWTCDHCHTENTGLVKVCSACNAPK